jgi:hypothetical protein
MEEDNSQNFMSDVGGRKRGGEASTDGETCWARQGEGAPPPFPTAGWLLGRRGRVGGDHAMAL